MYCFSLHCGKSNDQGDHCEFCGSPLIINGYRAIQQFSSNFFTQKLEVIDPEGKRSIAIVSRDASHLGRLFRFLQDIHAIARFPGIPCLEGDGLVAVELQHGPHHILLRSKTEGIPLGEWLEKNGPPPRPLLLNWFYALVDILDRIHSSGYLHRNINASSVIVSEDLSLTLIDFGSIRPINPKRSIKLRSPISRRLRLRSPIFMSNDEPSEIRVVGSVGYMAPEVVEGRYSPASDYFALGRLMTHIASATHPTKLPSRRPWQRPGCLNWQAQAPSVDPAVADFIDLFCDRIPDYRPQKAPEIQEFLESIPR